MPSSHNRPRFTRGHSCAPCYQRKVKCDGQRPCSTCVKHSRQTDCHTAHPAVVRLTAAGHEAIMSRLRHCENLLAANGISVDDQGPTGQVESPLSLRGTTEDEDGHVIIHRGHLRFVDNVIWNRLGSELADELPESSEVGESDVDEEFFVLDSPEDLLFGSPSSATTLAVFRPPIQQVFRLWQAFLDNFNPLTKIIHAPTTQQMISNAVADADGPNPSTEALLFSIYLCAVLTLSDEACLSQLGEPRDHLFRRFSHATKQALRKAKFLQSADIVVLQALTLYLLAMRPHLNDQSMFVLAGVAIRLAQSMGLHREQSLKNLSLFEAENRRRLWWQIAIFERQSAQISGHKLDVDFVDGGDTKKPSNLSDSSLSPFMREMPSEHDEPTEMLFCRGRFEIGKFLRQIQLVDKMVQATPAARLAQGEQAIVALEKRLQDGLLKKCDVSIPLHLLATLMGRSAVCQMRLAVRLALYKPGDVNMAPKDRQELFNLSLKILEYDNTACSNQALKSFSWHMANNFPFQAFIQVLVHLLHWAQDDELERVWEAVNQVYENRPQLIGDGKTPLSAALGNLVLKAWDARGATTDWQSVTNPYLATANVIQKLRSRKASRSQIAGSGASAIQNDLGFMEENLDWMQFLVDESHIF